MIEIRNLCRNYGDTVAVRDVSLDIERGEIVGLLGHNGAGKTTVMKMLTGFLEPSAGTIRVDGVDLGVDRTAAQHKIGYLPENAPLYTEMLVQDYLLSMAALRGVPAERRRAAVLDAAERTGLTERLPQPIATLSKGYRQRVGLAQAIVHGPDLLILDEPTNGLDPTQIRSIRELILSLGETTTVLLSTHILQEIEAVCDRVVVLIGGEVAADAPLSELTGDPALRVTIRGAGADAGAALADVAGVASVAAADPDPRLQGYDSWRVVCTQGESPVGAIVSLVQGRGWTLGAIGPERRTLETVFRELEAAHVTRRAA